MRSDVSQVSFCMYETEPGKKDTYTLSFFESIPYGVNWLEFLRRQKPVE